MPNRSRIASKDMAGRRRAPYWTFAVITSFLLRPVAAFLCTGSVGLRRTDGGCRAVRRTASDRRRYNGCSTLSSRRRTRRPEGAGGLRAALEVEPVRDLEIGSVLVAGSDNYGHMTFKAVALVYEHGEGGPTRAVCVDKGLDFTIGEMSSGDLGPLSNNRLFRGGEDGGEVAIMIHAHPLEGARPLGDTGLFVGGFVSALDLVERGEAAPGDFKFFFNHLAWPAGALQEQVDKGLWKLVRLPNDVLLETKRMRDMELWGRVQFALKKKVEQ